MLDLSKSLEPRPGNRPDASRPIDRPESIVLPRWPESTGGWSVEGRASIVQPGNTLWPALVAALYSQGSAVEVEDMAVLQLPRGAVLDGVSAGYPPGKGPSLYDGLSGGQLVCSLIRQAIREADPECPLRDVILDANRLVGQVFAGHQLDVSKAEVLGGAAGVAFEFRDGNLNIIQWGDCQAVVEDVNGVLMVTGNQVYKADLEQRAIMRELMLKHGSDRARMWAELYIIIASLRSERVNNAEHPCGYGLLNGQDALAPFLTEMSIPCERLRSALFCSDGLVPLHETRDRESMIAYFANRSGASLPALLDAMREVETAQSSTSHVAQTEATAIKISAEA